MLLKKAFDVKKFLEKNPIEILSEYIDIVPAKDGSGQIVVFEYKLPNIEQAKIFRDMYELAEKFQV